jgi:hypothetical protein
VINAAPVTEFSGCAGKFYCFLKRKSLKIVRSLLNFNYLSWVRSMRCIAPVVFATMFVGRDGVRAVRLIISGLPNKEKMGRHRDRPS